MRTSSFNIVQLGVVVLVTVLAIALLFPLIADSQRDRGHHHRRSQLRGIYQAIVTYGNANNGWYPGLDSTGTYVQPNPDTNTSYLRHKPLAQQTGIAVEDRFAILIEGEFITPDYAISPIEHYGEPKREWPGEGPFTSDHYSYAMLQVPQAGGRHEEWRQQLNPHAIVLADRNTAHPDQSSSIYADKGGPWRGHVAWNDGHAGFEQSDELQTQYGKAKTNPSDRLFQPEGDDDAYLIHSGN